MASISRRQFLVQLGQGALGVMGAMLLPRLLRADAGRTACSSPPETAPSGERSPSRPRCRCCWGGPRRPASPPVSSRHAPWKAFSNMARRHGVLWIADRAGGLAGEYTERSGPGRLAAEHGIYAIACACASRVKRRLPWATHMASIPSVRPAAPSPSPFRATRTPNARASTIPRSTRRCSSAVAAEHPDFYLTIGDDFSVDTLPYVDAEAVEHIYYRQRLFLGLVASSAPLFLTNGNHEQAARCNLDGTAEQCGRLGANGAQHALPAAGAGCIFIPAMPSPWSISACCAIITPGRGATRSLWSSTRTGIRP